MSEDAKDITGQEWIHTGLSETGHGASTLARLANCCARMLLSSKKYALSMLFDSRDQRHAMLLDHSVSILSGFLSLSFSSVAGALPLPLASPF